jgi:hypothetical protein
MVSPGHAACDPPIMDIRPQSIPELAKLAERVGAIELTTLDADGTLHSRPLRPQIGVIDEHRRVGLSYCRPVRETAGASGITQMLAAK